MTDTTLAINALQNDSYLQGMRDMVRYSNEGNFEIEPRKVKKLLCGGYLSGIGNMRDYIKEGEGMKPKELIKEIQRVKLSHEARKLEPYRKSEAMLQMREIAQQEVEQDNE